MSVSERASFLVSVWSARCSLSRRSLPLRLRLLRLHAPVSCEALPPLVDSPAALLLSTSKSVCACMCACICLAAACGFCLVDFEMLP